MLALALTASFADGFPTKLSEFTVSNIPPRAADEEGKVDPAKIKVKLRLDIHGILVLESAVAIEEEEVIEELPAPTVAPSKGEAPAETAPAESPPEATPTAPSAEDTATTPDATASAQQADEMTKEPTTPAAEPEKKKTKKVKRISLTVVPKGAGISSTALMEAQEAEAQMTLQDRLIAET